MTATHITSLVVSTELRANRVGPRGVRIPTVSRLGDAKATRERTSFSLPVVRARHPRAARFLPSW